MMVVVEAFAAGQEREEAKKEFEEELRLNPSNAGAEFVLAELARQVEQVHAIADTESGTTLNVTTFHGGTTINVIPDLAECDIDVRFSTMAEAERVSALSGFWTNNDCAKLGGR